MQKIAFGAPQERPDLHTLRVRRSRHLPDRRVAARRYLVLRDRFPHEPRSEFHENIQKFMAREDVHAETKQKICFENPKRMYR